MVIFKRLIVFIAVLFMAAPSFAVDLSLGGFPSFMRTRARYIGNATFLSALSNQNAIDLGFANNKDNIFFADTTLRLTPQLVLSDSVVIRAQLNVFDNNIWGGSTTQLLGGRNGVVNSNLSFSDRFRGAILTGPNAIDDPGFFDVRFLMSDIVLPHDLGFIRVGRQPFDWGLGMYLNGGWDPYSDLGTIFDRFLYLKSFAAGSSSITFVFVSDILTGGNSVVTGNGNGYDIGAAALIFNNPNVAGGNLTVAGFVFPYIHQNGVNTFPTSGTDPGVPPNSGAAVSGVDLHQLVLYSGLIDYKSDLFRLVGEMDGVWGKLKVDGVGDVDINASNIVFATRAEVYPGWPMKIIAAEFGWAKGDDLSTGSLEGGIVYFNPAYNLDNLLFKNIIPNIYQVESSVYNAYYGRLWGTVKLIDELSFTPQVLVAFNEETKNPYPGVDSINTYMGTEVEGTLTWHMYPGVNLDLIGGIVFPGNSLDTLLEAQAANTLAANEIDSDGVRYNETPYTVQGRLMVFIDQFFK